MPNQKTKTTDPTLVNNSGFRFDPTFWAFRLLLSQLLFLNLVRWLEAFVFLYYPKVLRGNWDLVEILAGDFLGFSPLPRSTIVISPTSLPYAAFFTLDEIVMWRTEKCDFRIVSVRKGRALRFYIMYAVSTRHAMLSFQIYIPYRCWWNKFFSKVFHQTFLCRDASTSTCTAQDFAARLPLQPPKCECRRTWFSYHQYWRQLGLSCFLPEHI